MGLWGRDIPQCEETEAQVKSSRPVWLRVLAPPHIVSLPQVPNSVPPACCFLQPGASCDTCSLGMRDTRTQEVVTYLASQETRVSRLFLPAKSRAQVTCILPPP